MNYFLVMDIVSLVLVVGIIVFFMMFKKMEEERFHNHMNAIMFGLFFVMVYFILSIVSYFVNRAMVTYSMALLVIPLASIFFLVSVLLPSE
jgi:hypothetical protein